MGVLMREKLEIADEARRIYLESNGRLTYEEALRQAQKEYKGYYTADQSICSNPNEMSNSIINQEVGIDNDEIYDNLTGKTIRGIIE